MREVKIDGKSYIPTVEAAKQFNYTQDYLGQLARKGRIDAQKIGRTWFVNSDSITTYQAELEVEVPSQESAKNPLLSDQTIPKHLPVKTDERSHPVKYHIQDSIKRISGTTGEGEDLFDTSVSDNTPRLSEMMKSSASLGVESTDNQDRQSKKNRLDDIASISEIKKKPRWQKITYEHDAYDLHPVTAKQANTTTLVSKQSTENASAESKKNSNTGNTLAKLKVYTTNDKYTVVSSEIPSVRLRGSIKVRDETMRYLDDTFQDGAVSKLRSIDDPVEVSADLQQYQLHDDECLRADSSSKMLSDNHEHRIKSLFSKLIHTTVAIGVTSVLLYAIFSLSVTISIDIGTQAITTAWEFVPLTWSSIWNSIH